MGFRVGLVCIKNKYDRCTLGKQSHLALVLVFAGYTCLNEGNKHGSEHDGRVFTEPTTVTGTVEHLKNDIELRLDSWFGLEPGQTEVLFGPKTKDTGFTGFTGFFNPRTRTAEKQF